MKSNSGVVCEVLEYCVGLFTPQHFYKPNSYSQRVGPHMTAIQIRLCERLKQLGFSRQSQIRLYGSQFELVGDPLVVSEDVVLVDAVERKSGESCRVRIPLNIV